MHKYVVEFQPIGRRIKAAAGSTISETARRIGVAIASDCGGRGTCGRCRIEILSGEVSKPEQNELKALSRIKASGSERLACLTKHLGDVKIRIPACSRAFDQKLQLEGRMRLPVGQKSHSVIQVHLASPSLEDQRSHSERLLNALPNFANHRLPLPPFLLRNLVKIAGNTDGKLWVYMRDGVPVGVGSPGTPPLGVAIDLGTTKIAAILLDLDSGRQIGTEGIINPQVFYGEDIISRLTYAMNNKAGASKLANLLCKALDRLIKDLCDRSGMSLSQVVDIAVSGNTAMCHLLLRIPIESLCRAPFIAGFSNLLEMSATELGLKNAPGARLTVLPCIGGFVGGDHVAMILACGLDQCDVATLGIDVGTNTEIVLAKPGQNGGIFVSSCASGPAFEGAHIRDGMRAASGAIERFQMTTKGPIVSTVNGGPPIGLCGSGLIDAVAELLRVGIIDERGHLQTDHRAGQSDPDGPSFVLVPARFTGNGQDIILTQKDISAIQLAKGAIQAGIRNLLLKTGTREDEVVAIYMAGAFGFHLNMESALSIGLLPNMPKARFIRAGNASAAGTCLVLMSNREKQRCVEISTNAKLVEPANDPQFSRLLVRALSFCS